MGLPRSSRFRPTNPESCSTRGRHLYRIASCGALARVDRAHASNSSSRHRRWPGPAFVHDRRRRRHGSLRGCRCRCGDRPWRDRDGADRPRDRDPGRLRGAGATALGTRREARNQHAQHAGDDRFRLPWRDRRAADQPRSQPSLCYVACGSRSSSSRRWRASRGTKWPSCRRPRAVRRVSDTRERNARHIDVAAVVAADGARVRERSATTVTCMSRARFTMRCTKADGEPRAQRGRLLPRRRRSG